MRKQKLAIEQQKLKLEQQKHEQRRQQREQRELANQDREQLKSPSLFARHKTMFIALAVLGVLLLGLIVANVIICLQKNPITVTEANGNNAPTSHDEVNEVIPLELDSLEALCNDDTQAIFILLNENPNDPAILYFIANDFTNHDSYIKDGKTIYYKDDDYIKAYWNILVEDGDVNQYIKKGHHGYSDYNFALLCTARAMRNLPNYNYEQQAKTSLRDSIVNLYNKLKSYDTHANIGKYNELDKLFETP